MEKKTQNNGEISPFDIIPLSTMKRIAKGEKVEMPISVKGAIKAFEKSPNFKREVLGMARKSAK